MLLIPLAILVGLSLGLLGGGGSVLTVPILVYSAQLPAKEAIGMSLAIVGITTIIGSISHYKNKNINIKLALIFSSFAIPGTFLGTYLGTLISGDMQLLIFAIVMILAASFMFKGRKEIEDKDNQVNYPLTVLSSFFVGTMTGLIGVGGGFLIVPALMFFTKTDMRRSVGTSLVIISINSFFGFISYMQIIQIKWDILIQFVIASIIGILIGSALVHKIPQAKLKKAFAVFLIIMGAIGIFKHL